MIQLTKLDLQGFKSIRHLQPALEFRPINVLIGANGAGKSNLVSFFKLLSWMMPAEGNLQLYVSRQGGANSILYDGAAVTTHMDATLTFQTEQGANQYQFRLFHAAGDTFVFAEERFRFSRFAYGTEAPWRSLGAGHRETRIREAAEDDPTARAILSMMRRCVVYQFHNTSDTARVKQKWSVSDDRFLKEDAANLAPFLYRLRESRRPYYSRIVETIRQVIPFFADFELEPDSNTVLLRWRERGADIVFGPHQASDGMLRLMALVTLLLQPEDNLPSVVILDEPELGLHPYAIDIVAGLLKSLSSQVQVILATQSMAFIDRFDPEDVIVVERPHRESAFTRLRPERLRTWLEEYSLAQLWEKNVIGGRPGR